MRWTEQLKTDRQRWYTLPDTGSKITFLYDYYKVPILVILITVILIVTSVVSGIGRSRVKFHAVLLNNDCLVTQYDESVFSDLMTQAGYDMSHSRVDVRTDLSLGRGETTDADTLQVLSALFMVSDVDLYIADEEYFRSFAEQGAFADLSLLADRSLWENTPEDLFWCTREDGSEILAGIILHQGSPLHEAGYYHNDVVMGVAAQADRLQEALDFLTEILRDRK